MTLDDLLPRILPYLPGCPSALARKHLLEAIRDWCEKTEIWVDDLPTVRSEAGRSDYVLNVDRHQEVIRLDHDTLNIGDVEYPIIGSHVARAEMRTRSRGLERFAWTNNLDDIHVWPAPSVSGLPIVLTAVLRPSEAATEIAREAVGRHADGVCAGAIFRLQSMPKKEWTDMDSATINNAKFEEAVQRATHSASAGFRRPHLRVTEA